MGKNEGKTTQLHNKLLTTNLLTQHLYSSVSIAPLFRMAQLHAHFGSSDAIQVVQAALGAFTEDGLESSTGVSEATTVSASPAIQYVSRSGSSYDRVMMEMGSRHAAAPAGGRGGRPTTRLPVLAQDSTTVRSWLFSPCVLFEDHREFKFGMSPC